MSVKLRWYQLNIKYGKLMNSIEDKTIQGLVKKQGRGNIILIVSNVFCDCHPIAEKNRANFIDENEEKCTEKWYSLDNIFY